MKKVVRTVAIKRTVKAKPARKPAAVAAPRPLPSEGIQPVRDCIRKTMASYFRHLDGHPTTDLYALVLREVEIPLLESVLAIVGGNQTQAAQLLGINRATLRKKLRDYGLAE